MKLKKIWQSRQKIIGEQRCLFMLGMPKNKTSIMRILLFELDEKVVSFGSNGFKKLVKNPYENETKKMHGRHCKLDIFSLKSSNANQY